MRGENRGRTRRSCTPPLSEKPFDLGRREDGGGSETWKEDEDNLRKHLSSVSPISFLCKRNSGIPEREEREPNCLGRGGSDSGVRDTTAHMHDGVLDRWPIILWSKGFVYESEDDSRVVRRKRRRPVRVTALPPSKVASLSWKLLTSAIQPTLCERNEPWRG